jgi:hypothetical protein
MTKQEIRLGDIVNVPARVDGYLDKGYTGTVIGIYSNLISIKPNDKDFRTTVMNCDIPKLKLVMHKANSTLEREFDDLYDSVK